MKVSNKNVILHNRYVLYLIFIIALGDLLTLVYNNDYYSASIFVLIGFLTSFFSKNMIVILFIAIAFTNIIKYGAKAGIEGMSSKESDDKEKDKSETELNDKEKDESEEDNKSEKNKKPKTTDDTVSLSVETNEGSNKEKFEQDKTVVYTSEEDKELAKTEKMILSQEKILKSMNKYKPLLDTLQGITKNMAIVKGAASASDE
jgi:hypothetical protein